MPEPGVDDQIVIRHRHAIDGSGAVLWVKDVELERREIIVRDGKGGKDRVTMLPESLVEPLRTQLALRRVWHEQDAVLGKADVWLPDALAVKYPNASKAWSRQYVFAAKNYSIDPRSKSERGHHAEEKQVQRYVKPATPRTLRRISL